MTNRACTNPVAAMAAVLILAMAGMLTAQTFTPVTVGPLVNDGGRSGGLAWIDVDGDGYLDVYVANGNQTNQANFLYRNLGNGDFQRITGVPATDDAAPSIGSTWGDYDSDGDPDVFVVNRENALNALYRNDGNGGFTRISSAPFTTDAASSNGASWVDLDTDGDLDLFVINFNGANALYRNDGGSFTAIDTGRIVTEVSPSINGAWSDMDNDGDLDLFLCNGGNQNNTLFRNQGGFAFTAESIPDGGSTLGCAWGDYDNDGDMDLYASNFLAQNNVLYRNSGAPEYRLERVLGIPPVNDGLSSVGAAWADFDQDGDLDLAVGNGQGQANRLYRNEGAGSFADWTVPGLTTDLGNTFSIAASDPDGDGDLDLLVANILNENNRFYRNDGTANHWVGIRCQGVSSNRDGIGARVQVRATLANGSLWQVREFRSQNGYDAQSGAVVYLGLGSATRIDSLAVRWPSGQIDRFADVPVDQVLTVVEGGGATGINQRQLLPAEATLAPNFPNPFNPTTQVTFEIRNAALVALSVFDMHGRAIRTLVNEHRMAGRHTVQWDGRDTHGNPVASGVYLYHLETGTAVVTRRMTLVR